MQRRNSRAEKASAFALKKRYETVLCQQIGSHLMNERALGPVLQFWIDEVTIFLGKNEIYVDEFIYSLRKYTAVALRGLRNQAKLILKNPPFLCPFRAQFV